MLSYFNCFYNESLPRKINICTKMMPPEFMAPTVIEDLLSIFCIFDTDGYNLGFSPDVNEYRIIMWTTKETNIPSTIIVYAAPTIL
jgi:hypothetical protein